jgi:hypothetical protein
MQRSNRIACCLLAFALTWVALTSASVARDDAFILIVHPSNPATVVERSFVRAAFLKQAARWPNGAVLRPIDTSAPAQVRDRFVAEVLNRTRTSLRAYWLQRIFSGTGVPPIEVASPEEAIDAILNHRGAVAYLPANVDPRGAKVITMR